MLERTVVCWNGTPASASALRWALRRARGPRGAPVDVFDVVDRGLFEGDPRALERATVQEEERFDAALRGLGELYPGTVGASALLVGDPLEVLLGQAGPRTLIVVGSSPRIGPRLRYGWSFGARLATNAVGAVAIVPQEEETVAGARGGVTVGVDGSDTAEIALAFASDEAQQLDQPLKVVHCWREPLADEPLIVPDEDFVDSHERAHRELLDDQLRRLRASRPGIEAEPVLLRRRPVQGLRLEAERAFMLVVGSRGLTGWRRAWVGSVSHGVVLDLAAPTVVVGPETSADL
ncbi:universal stress protein [Leifsonia poae]|uniref:universal stress protein n=1 Tax=Leifsonia poae TaxID=110933 RepID=UPI003D68210B